MTRRSDDITGRLGGTACNPHRGERHVQLALLIDTHWTRNEWHTAAELDALIQSWNPQYDSKRTGARAKVAKKIRSAATTRALLAAGGKTFDLYSDYAGNWIIRDLADVVRDGRLLVEHQQSSENLLRRLGYIADGIDLTAYAEPDQEVLRLLVGVHVNQLRRDMRNASDTITELEEIATRLQTRRNSRESPALAPVRDDGEFDE